MKINGGLDAYRNNGMRYMTETPPFGREVRFTNKNSSDEELQKAREYFDENELLVVSEIYIGKFGTQVKFVGYKELFDANMFEDVEVD